MTRSEIAKIMGWDERHLSNGLLRDQLTRIEHCIRLAVAAERAKHAKSDAEIDAELERLRKIARASGRLE